MISKRMMAMGIRFESGTRMKKMQTKKILVFLGDHFLMVSMRRV
jgi:hypothetical protein